MSGLFYLVMAVALAALGVGLLWFVEKFPHRDSLSAVREFDRARHALKRRHRPQARTGASQEAGTSGPARPAASGARSEGERVSTVTVIR